MYNSFELSPIFPILRLISFSYCRMELETLRDKNGNGVTFLWHIELVFNICSDAFEHKWVYWNLVPSR